MSTPAECFVGIDVSKADLDVHLRPGSTARRFDNAAEGIAGLIE
jgi:hypothetical protein